MIKDNVVTKVHKRTRTYGLFRMGMYETFCFMIVSDKTFVFRTIKDIAQVEAKWDQQKEKWK